jgi:RNA polymerase sigma factor (sigma-70 family)
MATPEQEEQFLLLIEQNKGIIYKIANSFRKDGEDKKDLVQEIIVQLWRAYPGFDGRSKISTWMYCVALNVAIASYRKDKKENEVMLPMHESILEFAEENETDDNEGHLKLLQQLISEMKELDRALMLLYLEEKSGKEMAEILGLSETNIRTKINRLKEKIKHRFSQINS